MPCFHPVPAWRARPRFDKTSDGRYVRSKDRSIAFSPADGWSSHPLELPCGKCVGCVQARASEWALRCEHEAKLWSDNWFITLTYEDGTLPETGLALKDLQDFWKRLRKEYPGLRYFACGEYGESGARAHYHALVFNWSPEVKSRKRLHSDEWVYECEALARIWGLGRVHLSPFTGAAAQYVANYVRKNFSVGGEPVDFGPFTKPFQVMSRRPGIGRWFVERFKRDIYPDGYVSRSGGSRRRAPRFYDNVVEATDAVMFRRVKRKRKELALARPKGISPWDEEKIEVRRQAFFDSVKGRKYENG